MPTTHPNFHCFTLGNWHALKWSHLYYRSDLQTETTCRKHSFKANAIHTALHCMSTVVLEMECTALSLGTDRFSACIVTPTSCMITVGHIKHTKLDLASPVKFLCSQSLQLVYGSGSCQWLTFWRITHMTWKQHEIILPSSNFQIMVKRPTSVVWYSD